MDPVFRRDTESYQHSQSGRIRDFLMPLREALGDPAIFVIGRGPAKSAMRTDSHNDYGWYFHRFGLMGLGFYLLLLYWGLRLGYRRFVRTTDPLDQSIAMTGVLAVVTWAMFAMAESLWKDPQIMTVTMFLYGMLHAPAMPMRRMAVRAAIRGKRNSVTLRPAAGRPVQGAAMARRKGTDGRAESRVPAGGISPGGRPLRSFVRGRWRRVEERGGRSL